MNPFAAIAIAAIPALLSSVHAGRAAEAVTTAGVPVVSGAGNSLSPVMTPDGRFAAFASHANNLVTNDDLRPHLDVFVRDRTLSHTSLVSVNLAGIGGGDGDSGYPLISTNGQFVVFASEAANLIPNDTNRVSDIFLRDLASGATHLVSARPDGQVGAASSLVASPFNGSSKPVMTPDARWIAFES